MDDLAGLFCNMYKETVFEKTGFEASFCKSFNNKRKRPVIMDRVDDQPVRLASPSYNVLDYSKRNSRGTGMQVQTSILLLLMSSFIAIQSIPEVS